MALAKQSVPVSDSQPVLTLLQASELAWLSGTASRWE
jgi:hypothetical protein